MAELVEKYAGKKAAIVGFLPEKIDLSGFPGNMIVNRCRQRIT
jgi:hypothetical protein